MIHMADRSSWSKARQLYYLYYIACGYTEEQAEHESAYFEEDDTWTRFAELIQSEGLSGNSGRPRPWVPEKFDPNKIYEATHGIAKAPK
jgi:hypothetical protein